MVKELIVIEQKMKDIQKECSKRAIEYQAELTAIDNIGLSYYMKPSTRRTCASIEEENIKGV